MGILEVIGGALGGGKKKDTLASKKYKCPNCGENVTLEMERCAKCGIRIKSMFRKKCPKCGTANELDNEVCSECKYDFNAEIRAAKKTLYKCPRCGYEMDVWMQSCPACGVRFG